MKGHKSTLKALEPVEIRLASAVRVRREIERLRTIEQALDADAYAIANEVLGGKAPVVEVFLEALKEPLETDPNDFDQEAVAAFLSSEHALNLDGAAPAAAAAGASATFSDAPVSSPSQPSQAAEVPPIVEPAQPADVAVQPVAPPSGEAPVAEVASRSTAIAPLPAVPDAGASAPVTGPAPASPVVPAAEVAARAPAADPAPPATDANPGPSAAFLAIRLADYDIVMPDDYFGIAFDMVKRAEADAILGEAALAVADQIPLDASPYKGDRGKVHWRRRLFEEAYAYFQLHPPRPIEVETVEPALPQAPPPPLDALDFGPSGGERVDEAVSTSPDIAPEGSVDLHEQGSEAGSGEGSEDRGASRAGSEADAVAELPLGNSDGGSEAAPAVRPPSADEQPPATGQVIGFPGTHAAARLAAPHAEDDIVNVFEDRAAGSPDRTSTDDRNPAESSSETSGYEGPSYDGPDWDAPIDELDGRFADAMASDDRGSDDDRHQDEDDEPGIDHAAAAALAAAVPPPAAAPVPTVPAAALPSAGVPPRPPALVSSLRSAPALPPRPSVAPVPAASPAPVRAASPAPAPAVAPAPAPSMQPAASVAGRVAPRAVSVRPPGL